MGTKFKEIGEAYSVLSDEQKRKNYDQFGTEKPQSTGTGTGFSSSSSNPFASGDSQFTYNNAENLFQQFFFNFGDGNVSSNGSSFGGFPGMNPMNGGHRGRRNGMKFKGDTVSCEVGVT